jgi:hypothetical protein
MRDRISVVVLTGLALWVGACGEEPADKSGTPEPEAKYEDPGATVALKPPADEAAAYAALQAEVESAQAISRADFDRTYAVEHPASLGYDPLAALNLDLVQESPFELDPAQLEELARTGLVIKRDQSYPYFLSGLKEIYASDLPLYVSADAILDALHLSFDDILASVERTALVPALEQLLSKLRARLDAGAGELGDSRADLALYLSVAEGLLANTRPEGDTAGEIYDMALEASGSKSVTLFGVERDEDFSQFVPRGHYAGDPVLESYFRASMWLGRVDFRLIETQPDGSQLFRRRQVEAMLALADLFDADALALFERIDTAIGEFVGESDYMGVGEAAKLRADLKLAKLSDLDEVSDARLAQAIIDGGYGQQRIASHLIINLSGKELPLNRSFALLGQRYVLDSHVFSNVVWARTKQKRMMPSPLDVAFAALGNNQAAALLDGELDTYAYQGNLHAMRRLSDAHDAAYWTSTLYTSWLDALRGLSPHNLPHDAPTLMQTEAFGRRTLNAQLGSWAQLRHDTILYAKQSYTDGVGCEFPDAYVEPYPAFWSALVRYAERGQALAERLEGTAPAELVDRLREHFGTTRSTLDTLRGMAEQQLTGMPFSAEQLAFINEAVRIDPAQEPVCGEPPRYVGWYTRLQFQQGVEFDPTIADVHTQPTDEVGNEVGKVLHVGTGAPRASVLTIDTCQGPRAYVGLVFAYHEVVTEQYTRLTDDQFAGEYFVQPPADVSWLEPIVE